ncbi:MAG: hypothetical protein IKA06_03195 [Clostridia bacterium]|nr:hypothetical protein [Clostridia bacterium]
MVNLNKEFHKISIKNRCPFLTTLVSGSPIVQDGRIVGTQCLQSKLATEQSGIASHHVLIGDPTTGYGIFIENLLGNMPKAG